MSALIDLTDVDGTDNTLIYKHVVKVKDAKKSGGVKKAVESKKSEKIGENVSKSAIGECQTGLFM